MYAFIHIPKTAGSSLRAQLRATFRARHCDIKVPSRRRKSQPWIEPRDLQLARPMYPSLAGICGHRVTCFTGLEQVAPGIRYFTFLRDPLQRFISHFHHAHRGRTDHCTVKDLIAYADDPDHRNIQTRWLCGTDEASRAIERIESRIGLVGLTEHFDESVFLLHRWLGIPPPNALSRVVNPSHGAAPLPYLEDPELTGIFTQANLQDLEVYRYAVKTRFPRQLADYGDTLYASATGSHQAPYASWQTAPTDIQAAIEVAADRDRY